MQSKNQKRQRVLSYLENQLTWNLTEKAKERIQNEIEILKKRLSGIRKKKIVKEVKEDDNWYIEIWAVKYSKLKTSESKALRKKGKSTKAVKKSRKTMSLVKVVKNRPGLISTYKFGQSEYSPKNHIFKLVQK